MGLVEHVKYQEGGLPESAEKCHDMESDVQHGDYNEQYCTYCILESCYVSRF